MRHILIICTLLLLPLSANAQQFLLDYIDPSYQDVIDALNDDNPELAATILTPVPDKDADYHYLQSMLVVHEIENAGTIRTMRLVRRMRRQLEQALEYDPDHQLSHFNLTQWHLMAPGMLGGSDTQQAYHRQRLSELDSELQFTADIVVAQVNGDQQAELDTLESWRAHSPHSIPALQMSINRLISLEEFQQAAELIEYSLTALPDTDHSLFWYEQLRLSAASGLYLQEAQIAEQSLHNLATAESKIDMNWVALRAAEIDYHRGEHSTALARLDSLPTDDKDQRFNEEVERVRGLLL